MSGGQRSSVLLDLALELPPEDRPGFVERVCAGDEMLRDRVERLLGSCERADGVAVAWR